MQMLNIFSAATSFCSGPVKSIFCSKILDRLSANLVHIGGGVGAASEKVQEPIKGAVN